MEENQSTQNSDKKSAYKALITFALVVVAIIIAGKFFLKPKTPAQPLQTPQTTVENNQDIVLSSPQAQIGGEEAGNEGQVTELKIEDTKVGTGEEAVIGSKAIVHYTGYLTNGTEFDSSVKRGQPFGFTIGAGQVIQGWEKGVAGMKVGGKRKLTIPPDLAYGEAGAGGVIPPNATLVFDIELVDVE